MNSRAVAAQTQVFSPGVASLWLSGAVAVVTTLAAALTFWVPGILTGPDVMNGSARGTALVLLVLAVPAMTSSIGPAARGSARAVVIWIGSLAYIVYNATMLVFATPFNPLFLLYVAMLSLSIATLICLLIKVEPSRIHTNRLPVRALATYVWAIVLLNALAWLRTIVPAMFADDPTGFLKGTGIATSPSFVQDLAIWLPAMTVAGFWLWHRRPWGILLAGAGLVFWVMEAVGIAVDQWFGAQADPSSDVASMSAVPAFAAFALVGVVPLWFHLRALKPITPG